MLSRLRRIFSPKNGNDDEVSVQECPIHGKAIFLNHMINSRCALCDGYTAQELRKIIKRIRAREGY